MEKWKTIGVFDNYLVSNTGKIKHIHSGKELKLSVTNGYFSVSLSQNGKKATFRVHRLVALTWIPNLENKKTINHIDGNKCNNNVGNLEWNSSKENHDHARKNRLIKDNKPIRALILDTMESLDFYSISEASRYFGFNKSYIHRAMKRPSKIYKNIYFSYLEYNSVDYNPHS